jgi:2-C-methyl-D-erythritol 4-phosphate cytidylyltransferase
MAERTRQTAIIVAGGTGTRMGSGLPKQFLTLGGKPVLQWSIERFLGLHEVDAVVVVLHSDWLVEGRERCVEVADSPRLLWTTGGAIRQDSVYAGLLALGDDPGLTAVHDAARPGITSTAIAAGYIFAQQRGNAVFAIPSTDTLVSAEQGIITGDIPRQTTWAVQTPQIFPGRLLKTAIEKARAENREGTDDAGLVRRLGHEIHLFPGARRFMKLTGPEDLEILTAIL